MAKVNAFDAGNCRGCRADAAHDIAALPLTYAAVGIGLVAAAVLAAYLPVRRASAIDPVEALKAE